MREVKRYCLSEFAEPNTYPVGPGSYVATEDYEALRAENERLSNLADTGAGIASALGEINTRLRAELEEARGLLEQRIPCDVMLPPASRIKRGCTLRTILASIKLREDFAPNKRVFTSAPAPEVKAEQGERQEAACWVPRACLDKLRNGCNNSPAVLTDGPAEFNDTPLYATPQPGPDVRDLVEALEECAASLAWNCFGECRAIHAGPIMPAAMALDTARTALAAHRQAQRPA